MLVEGSLTTADGAAGADARAAPSSGWFRRSARLLFPGVLVLLAFPNLAEVAGRILSSGGPATGALICAISALLWAPGRLGPRPGEPDVHDRQVDVILGLPLIGVALWLSLGWRTRVGLGDGLSDHEVAAAVAFTGGVCLFVLGTRAVARLRWALLLALAAAPTLSSHRLIPTVVVALTAVELLRTFLGRRHPARNRRRFRPRVAAVPDPGSAPPDRWPRARIAAAGVTVVALGLGASMAAATDSPRPQAAGRLGSVQSIRSARSIRSVQSIRSAGSGRAAELSVSTFVGSTRSLERPAAGTVDGEGTR